MALVTAAAEEDGSGLRWGGGGEYEVAFWTPPPHVYIDIQRQPKGLSHQIFAIPSEFGPIGLLAFQKKKKIILNIITNKNYYKVYYMN